jgi:hypothetical protein
MTLKYTKQDRSGGAVRHVASDALLCDGDCNHCPVVGHDNSRMLTAVLNALHARLGDAVYEIVENHCPNFTVCYECRIDDFCHVEGCEFDPQNARPHAPERSDDSQQRVVGDQS